MDYGCNGCNKKKHMHSQDQLQIKQLPTCNPDIMVCGSINIPQGFQFNTAENLDWATNACLECRTEDVSIECTTGIVDRCGPISGTIQVKAVRAVGCFNYIFNVPVKSTCPVSNANLSLEDSVCVNQVICVQSSTFQCDQQIAKCDISLIYISVRQVTAEGCTRPTRFDIHATYRLFENICPSSASAPLPEAPAGFDKVYVRDKTPDGLK